MKHLVILATCMLCLSAASAQISLKPTLDSLAQIHDVHFIYEDKTIEGKKTGSIGKDRKKLEGILDNLLLPLNIKWSRLDNDNYVIYPLSKSTSTLVESENTQIQIRRNTAIQSNQFTSLSGFITDNTGNSIPYATLSLLHDSSLVKIEVADSTGHFILNNIPFGKFNIAIESVGFYTKTIENIDIDTTAPIAYPTIILTKNPNELKSVTVQSRRPTIKYEGNKLIFNVENSPLKEGYNAMELLARTPKLHVNGLGNLILGHSQPQVYINGRKQNLNGQDLTSFLQAINADMIKSIEIQTTGLANTDAASSGGIVNIILKKIPNGFNGQLSGTGIYRNGNIWGGIGGASFNYGSQKWNLYSRINYSITNDSGYFHIEKSFAGNGYSNTSQGSFRDNNYKNFNVLGGAVFYPNESNQVGFEVYYKHGVYPSTFQEEININTPNLSAIGNSQFSDDIRSDNWYSAVNYTLKTDNTGSSLKFIGDFGRNWSTTSDVTTIHYTMGDNPDNSIKYISQPTSSYYTIQTDFEKKSTGKINYTAGLKYSTVKRDNIRTTFSGIDGNDWQPITDNNEDNFNNNENVLAGYASSQITLNDKNNVNIGLRMENTNFKGINKNNGATIKQNYTGFFPSMGFSHALSSDKNIVFSYARKIARPSFTDLNPFTRKENDYSYILGNPNLKPSYYNNLELEYQAKTQSITTYYMLGNNMVNGIYRSEGNVTYYQPVNFGKQSYFGITYSYFGNITKWMYANFSQDMYHYRFRKDSALVNNNTFSSNLYLNIKFNKTLSLDLSNLYIYRGKSFVIETANYYRMDATLQQKLANGKALLRLYWNDVFNTSRDKNYGNYQLFNMSFYQKRVTQNFRLMFVYYFSNNQKIKDKKVESNNDIRNRL